MAKAIIAALRKLDQLRGSLRTTAIEIAHLADGFTGEARVAYSTLKYKTATSLSTVKRHIPKLLDMGILERQSFYGANGKWGTNKYRFLIPWERPAPRVHVDRQAAFGGVADPHTAQMSFGSTMIHSLPNPEVFRPKFHGWERDKQAKEKTRGWLDNPDGVLGRLLMEFG